MSTQFDAIYSALSEIALPYELPKAWAWSQVDPNCRMLADPAEAVAKLSEQFSQEDLVASGVAVQAGGELAPSPKLLSKDPGLLVLRNRQAQAFEIATAAGGLNNTAAVLRIHCDDTTAKVLKAYPRGAYPIVFGCFSMLDVAVLRSLGLAAVPAAGLESLSFVGHQRLRRLVGAHMLDDIEAIPIRFSDDEPDDPAAGPMHQDRDPCLFCLRLLAGSFSRLEAVVPEALNRIALSLTQATRNAGFDWQNIRVWYPKACEFEKIAYRAGCGYPLPAVQAILGSRQLALEAFVAPGTPKLAPPPTAADKLLRFFKPTEPVSQRPGPMSDRGDYEAWIEKAFIRPLLERAFAAKDLDEQALAMHQAMLARMYWQTSPTVIAWHRYWAAEMQFDPSRPFPDGLFKEWQRLAGKLIEVTALRATLTKPTKRRKR